MRSLFRQTYPNWHLIFCPKHSCISDSYVFFSVKMHHPLEREDTNIYFYNVKGEGDDKSSLAMGALAGQCEFCRWRIRQSVYLSSNGNASKDICLQGCFSEKK